jgi:hypothetical protein
MSEKKFLGFPNGGAILDTYYSLDEPPTQFGAF